MTINPELLAAIIASAREGAEVEAAKVRFVKGSVAFREVTHDLTARYCVEAGLPPEKPEEGESDEAAFRRKKAHRTRLGGRRLLHRPPDIRAKLLDQAVHRETVRAEARRRVGRGRAAAVA